ncbi:invasion protein IalB [Hoeflea marina]|uniref:Invasion protein IalB n=1 Tax=Hoeflea marina TaxID=274592 RepID=A0A317PJE3_9HYPH|nr:invasion associated locus B family protein [Hoeflea marina]PWV98363.1 invasion protein IalB [Hoeflea marina]
MNHVAFRLLVLACMAVMPSPSLAEDAADPKVAPAQLSAAPGDEPAPVAPDAFVWDVDCRPVDAGKRLGCVLRQQLVVQGGSQVLLDAEIVPKGSLDNPDSVIKLHFPHGLALNAVIGLRIDNGEVFKLPLQRSDENGLYTTMAIGEKVLGLMQNGRAAQISFVLTSGKLVTLDLSLFGFTAAYNAILTLQALRFDAKT